MCGLCSLLPALSTDVDHSHTIGILTWRGIPFTRDCKPDLTPSTVMAYTAVRINHLEKRIYQLEQLVHDLLEKEVVERARKSFKGEEK